MSTQKPVSSLAIKENIILQFSLGLLVVVSVVAIALGGVLTASMTRQSLAQHVTLFPEIVSVIAQDDPEIVPFFTRGGQETNIPRSLMALIGLGDVFRLKIWDMDATVLYSDEPTLIGRRFPANPDYQAAKHGQVTYSIKRPAKAENLKERDRSVVLEIYVPVIHGGRQLGIVELYEAANELFLHIAARNRVVWQMVAGAGLILYCLLFAIFFAAHQRQKRAHHSLLRTQEAIITALAGQAEIRDLETGRHLERATAYVSLLLEELRKGPHRHSLPEQLCHEIRKSAPLHDIGKVGIPDAILCKSGELTKKEFDLMQRHCIYGEQVLRNAAAQLGFHSFLAVAASMARSHHERWDGGGYPDGLAGDAIPLAARVMALADVYDALRSSRCYKTGLDHAAARDIIIAERGRQFDPVIVDAFLAQEEAFAQVAASLPDSN